MIQLKLTHTVAFSGLIILCIAAWFLQSHLLLNWDVSWDLLIAKRLSEGGNYTHDFFDLNPPLLFYLLIPPVLIAKYFSLNLPLSFRFYIFTLSILSLSLCTLLANRIFLKQHRPLAYLMLAMLTLTFLVIPMMDFGEREHLLFIFTFPYFLAVICRLEKYSLPAGLALSIGILAFVGFALKPYFLILPLLIETFVLIYTRTLFSWARIETILGIGLLLSYFFFIYSIHPDYLSSVIPIAMQFYYQGFSAPWHEVLYNHLMFFCTLSILVCISQYKKNPYKIPSIVFIIALLGFLIPYFIQQTAWSYHVLPAFCMALLLITFMFACMVIEHPKFKIFLPFSFALLFFIPLNYLQVSYSNGLKYKHSQHNLITFLHTHAKHEPVYFITASPREIFPAVDYAESIYASRLLHLFWIPGIVKKVALHDSSFFSPQEKAAETTLITMMVEDIAIKKPKFILVDVKSHKSFHPTIAFDYLPYLMHFSSFQTVWKPYQYIKTISGPSGLQNPNDWKLYVSQKNERVDPKKLEGNVVVLTGEGIDKIAYYVENHHILQNDYGVFQTNLRLNAQTLSQLPREGGGMNASFQKSALAQDILRRVVMIPAYEYEIYQRKEMG